MKIENGFYWIQRPGNYVTAPRVEPAEHVNGSWRLIGAEEYVRRDYKIVSKLKEPKQQKEALSQ